MVFPNPATPSPSLHHQGNGYSPLAGHRLIDLNFDTDDDDNDDDYLPDLNYQDTSDSDDDSSFYESDEDECGGEAAEHSAPGMEEGDLTFEQIYRHNADPLARLGIGITSEYNADDDLDTDDDGINSDADGEEEEEEDDSIHEDDFDAGIGEDTSKAGEGVDIADTSKGKRGRSSGGAAKKQKTKNHVKAVVDTRGKLLHFVFDVETTGSSRQYDRIIEIGIHVVDIDGNYHGEFKTRIGSPVEIDEANYRVHKISAEMIKGMDHFNKVGPRIIAFMESKLGKYDTGVLVAHNGEGTDFKYFICELLRNNLVLPANIRYTLDTLSCIKRFTSLDYWKVSVEEWPNRQEKSGKPSMKLASVADYILKNPERIGLVDGPIADNISATSAEDLSFRRICGEEHEALADTRAAALILTDKKGIRLRDQWGLYRPYADVLADVCELFAKPPIEHESPGGSWTEVAVGEDPPSDLNPEDLPPFSRESVGPSEYLLQRCGLAGKTEEEIKAMDPSALMLSLFFYYFSKPLLERIVADTNAYATRKVIVVETIGEDGKKKKKKISPRTAAERNNAQQNCKKWKPLTVSELVVYLGVFMAMAVVNHKRMSHYFFKGDDWSTFDVITESMKEERFLQIQANLTFRDYTTDEDNKTDRLAKIRPVSDALADKAKKAYNPGQHNAIDESMIATSSRYCPYKQLMRCKPIKNGIKVFCFVDSDNNYLYSFDIYTGKNSSTANPSTSFIEDLICNKLLDEGFDNTGTILYMDAYFTAPKIFEELRKRGIYAVGPTKAKRPETTKGRTDRSWPLQTYSKNQRRFVGGKGWMRQVIRAIQGTLVAAIMATVWLDNKFLHVYHTCFMKAADDDTTVLRWTKSLGRRVLVKAPLPIQWYQKKMGGVDRVDKSNALANIRMKRCQKRYHRVIFFWLLSSFGHHNVKVLFELLLGKERVEKLQRDNDRFGYFHWFQWTLAKSIIREGLKLSREEALAANPGADSVPSPHFMPTREMIVRPSNHFMLNPPNHEYVLCSQIEVEAKRGKNKGKMVNLPRAYCAECKKTAEHCKEKSGKYIMPNGETCPRIARGCTVCKLCFCSENCYELYDPINHADDQRVVTP